MKGLHSVRPFSMVRWKGVFSVFQTVGTYLEVDYGNG